MFMYKISASLMRMMDLQKEISDLRDDLRQEIDALSSEIEDATCPSEFLSGLAKEIDIVLMYNHILQKMHDKFKNET